MNAAVGNLDPIARLLGAQRMTLRTAVSGANADGGTPARGADAFAADIIKQTTAPGELRGALCASVKAQRMPSIDVQFGCSTRVNPPKQNVQSGADFRWIAAPSRA